MLTARDCPEDFAALQGELSLETELAQSVQTVALWQMLGWWPLETRLLKPAKQKERGEGGEGRASEKPLLEHGARFGSLRLHCGVDVGELACMKEVFVFGERAEGLSPEAASLGDALLLRLVREAVFPRAADALQNLDVASLASAQAAAALLRELVVFSEEATAKALRKVLELFLSAFAARLDRLLPLECVAAAPQLPGEDRAVLTFCRRSLKVCVAATFFEGIVSDQLLILIAMQVGLGAGGVSTRLKERLAH